MFQILCPSFNLVMVFFAMQKNLIFMTLNALIFSFVVNFTSSLEMFHVYKRILQIFLLNFYGFL